MAPSKNSSQGMNVQRSTARQDVSKRMSSQGLNLYFLRGSRLGGCKQGKGGGELKHIACQRRPAEWIQARFCLTFAISSLPLHSSDQAGLTGWCLQSCKEYANAKTWFYLSWWVGNILAFFGKQ